jgi:hypothetical protein
MTGGFEWMYPLHVAAPCVVFWMYRREHRNMAWLVGGEFDQVPSARFPLWALTGSPALFGAMHGGQWLADAVLAHAVTNAPIAVSGLGWWKLW